MSEEGDEPRPRLYWRRLLPLAIIVIALFLFFALGLHRQISLEGLREHRALLLGWTSAHPLSAAGGFLLLAILVMAIGFPSVAVIMAGGGLLFGLWEGGVLSLIGTTLGSFILFLAARSARDAALGTRLGGLFTRLEAGSKRNAFLYLLSMRIMPIFPTVGVTLAAAAAWVNARDFLAATFIGLMPAAIVYTGIGAGAGALLDDGDEASLARAFFRPEVLWPLIGLAVLSLASAWWRVRAAKG